MSASAESKKRLRPEVEEAMQALAASETVAESPAPKKARTEERRSLFVRSLPPSATNESLAEFFSEYFPVKHAVVVVDQQTKESRGFGFVTLADGDDAKEAKTVFDKKKWDGRSIRVDVAEPRQRNAAEGEELRPKPGKPEMLPAPKLIVRNLPWTIRNAEQLSHLFRSYGKVKFADLPKNKGKLKGFGFVTLRGRKNAEKALEGVNGKEIDGRTVAVDWAVDKATWDKQQEEEEEQNKAGEDDSETSEEEDSDEDEEEDENDEDGGAAEGGDQLNADLENFMQNHMQNMVDEDEEEEEEEEGDKEERHAARNTANNSLTVFVRNLPFTTTDDQLKTFFSTFGTVKYARIVMDKTTDRPAGTGFVCFVEEDDAKNCIKQAPRTQQLTTGPKKSILLDENADPTGRYTLDGRLLSVVQAVNRTEATNLAENSLAKRREKDKRRLYLLPEGSIGTDSPLYNLLSLPEIRMRQASAAQRKKQVQSNPTLHMSLTRIALRNIPRNIGSKELKELARKAVVGFAQDVKEGKREPLSKEENARDGKDAREKERQRRLKGKGIVKQAKIVFESIQGSKINETEGAGKSRGYGFVEYFSHHWALMGLRYLNGHQMEEADGKKKRLVAEFAIENAQVVQRRKANEERSRQPREARGKPNGQDNTGAKEQERGQQQQQRQHSNNNKGRGGGSGGGKPDRRPRLNNNKGNFNKGPREPRRTEKKPLKDKFTKDGTGSGGGGGGDGDKDGMKQKLIGRKRIMRKKKGDSRGKN